MCSDELGTSIPPFLLGAIELTIIKYFMNERSLVCGCQLQNEDVGRKKKKEKNLLHYNKLEDHIVANCNPKLLKLGQPMKILLSNIWMMGFMRALYFGN
jgi:hypothetical protein